MPFAARSVLKSAAWLGFLASCVLILGNTYIDVRLGDQAILLYDAETKSHVPASEHPRVAPKPSLVVVPAKPA